MGDSLGVCVGRVIRILRKQQGVTQRFLAQRAEITPAYLCMIESGKRAEGIRLETLTVIAWALCVKVSTLVELAETLQ